MKKSFKIIGTAFFWLIFSSEFIKADNTNKMPLENSNVSSASFDNDNQKDEHPSLSAEEDAEIAVGGAGTAGLIGGGLCLAKKAPINREKVKKAKRLAIIKEIERDYQSRNSLTKVGKKRIALARQAVEAKDEEEKSAKLTELKNLPLEHKNFSEFRNDNLIKEELIIAVQGEKTAKLSGFKEKAYANLAPTLHPTIQEQRKEERALERESTPLLKHVD